jgi:hypothetical protein
MIGRSCQIVNALVDEPLTVLGGCIVFVLRLHSFHENKHLIYLADLSR